jgi:hypothetical protein
MTSSQLFLVAILKCLFLDCGVVYSFASAPPQDPTSLGERLCLHLIMHVLSFFVNVLYVILVVFVAATKLSLLHHDWLLPLLVLGLGVLWVVVVLVVNWLVSYVILVVDVHICLLVVVRWSDVPALVVLNAPSDVGPSSTSRNHASSPRLDLVPLMGSLILVLHLANGMIILIIIVRPLDRVSIIAGCYFRVISVIPHIALHLPWLDVVAHFHVVQIVAWWANEWLRLNLTYLTLRSWNLRILLTTPCQSWRCW